MNKLLEAKIELALIATATNTLLYARDQITWEEVLQRIEKSKKDVYKFVAQMEPTHESEVI
jgi:purine nucleoside phosphorylase